MRLVPLGKAWFLRPPPYPIAGVDNGGQVIYVAACDVGMTYSTGESGCTGTRGEHLCLGLNTVETGYQSQTTGKTNSAGSAALGSSYAAATACENLTAHGYSDWVSSASSELVLLYNMKNLIGIL